jgi:hypothetical protein
MIPSRSESKVGNDKSVSSCFPPSDLVFPARRSSQYGTHYIEMAYRAPDNQSSKPLARATLRCVFPQRSKA